MNDKMQCGVMCDVISDWFQIGQVLKNGGTRGWLAEKGIGNRPTYNRISCQNKFWFLANHQIIAILTMLSYGSYKTKGPITMTSSNKTN
jgi:hypothetical protein